MNTSTEVLNESVLYLQIYSSGIIFNVIYNMAARIQNMVVSLSNMLVQFSVNKFGVAAMAMGIGYTITAMHYFCPFYWALNLLQIMAGSVRRTGKSLPPMAILIFSLCIFRIAWITFIMPHFNVINAIFILYPTSWILGMILMGLYTWKTSCV